MGVEGKEIRGSCLWEGHREVEVDGGGEGGKGRRGSGEVRMMMRIGIG